MTAVDLPLVDLAAVQAARELLQGVARVTPVEGSRWLSRAVGGAVSFKCENLQHTGSFKIRGAYVRIARLTDEERSRGVVAASAGNHAQGVALAARLLACDATVFMPEAAPLPKVEATKSYGATVVLHGATLEESLAAATAWGERTGAVLIHPFNHTDVIAGQGTVALELLEQCPDVKTIVVSTGGGGLISGMGAAVKALRPDVQLVGVQAAGASAFPASLAAGHPVPLSHMATIADGIAVGCPGDITLRHVMALVDRITTVDEDALSRALLLCLERAKLVVEPAGAAAVAALMEHPTEFEPPVVAVLSGGNIDPVLLSKVIRHGMIAAGRYLSLRVLIPDRPGQLAHLLGILAESGANVLDVEHQRTGRRLHLDEVEVDLQLETRGREHGDAVMTHLEHAGYSVAPG